MQYTHKYSSPLGAITTASDGQKLTGLWFDGQKYFGRTLEKEHEEKFLSVFECADAWLDMYFSGKEPDFTPPLALAGSPFRQKVWDILLAIPYGTTTTYGAIAAQIAIRCDMLLLGIIFIVPAKGLGVIVMPFFT